MKYIWGPTAFVGTVLVGAFCLLSEPVLCTHSSTDKLKCSGNYEEMRRKKIGSQGASSGKSFAKCKECGTESLSWTQKPPVYFYLCIFMCEMG